MQSVVCGSGAVVQPLQRRQSETGESKPYDHLRHITAFSFLNKYTAPGANGEIKLGLFYSYLSISCWIQFDC